MLYISFITLQEQFYHLTSQFLEAYLIVATYRLLPNEVCIISKFTDENWNSKKLKDFLKLHI